MTSHGKKHRTAWSEWQWSEDFGREYRQRYNKKGEIETEYKELPSENVPRTPVGDADRDQLSDQIARLGLGHDPAGSGGYYGTEQGSSYMISGQGDYTLDVSGQIPADHRGKGKGKSVDKGKGAEKSKSSSKSGHFQQGKTRDDEGSHLHGHDPFYRKSSSGQGKPEELGASSGYTQPEYLPEETISVAAKIELQQLGHDPVADEDIAQNDPGWKGKAPATQADEEQYDPQYDAVDLPGRHVHFPEDDPGLQAAIDMSRAQYYGAQMPGQSSSGAYDDIPDDDEEEDDDERSSFSAKRNSRTHITGTPGEYEPTDHRFRIWHSDYWQPGMVFKILWPEPQGHNIKNFTERNTVYDNGRKFYEGIRRYIIVRADDGHCTCVPILTYSQQGCKKKGVKPKKHGIVYQDGKNPMPLSGEPKLGFKPVRMIMEVAGVKTHEKITRESRVNYAKLMTVEHNVKVFFIGYIDDEDFDAIACPAVEQCWNEKRQHKNRHH